MTQVSAKMPAGQAAQIVDFDDFLLAARSADERENLLDEAELLASVFAPDGRPEALRDMAEQLSQGQRDGEMSRSRARGLAAALKRLANGA